jgi:hypothetical protein
MLIGRHSSLSGAVQRPSSPEHLAGRRWTGVLRIAGYGLLGLLGLVVGLTLAPVVLGRHAPPARMAEPPMVATSPLPEAAPAPSATAGATPDAADADAQLRAVRTQVQSEIAVLAALRDRIDEARTELADLQRQQETARVALAELQLRNLVGPHQRIVGERPHRRVPEQERKLDEQAGAEHHIEGAFQPW